MSKFIDLTGQKFGKLTPVKFFRDSKGRILWECKCDCGNVKIAKAIKLRLKNVRSCGCLRHESWKKRKCHHSFSKTPTHNSWLSMKSRCYNKSNSSYKDYGGRGIKVCKRWLGKRGFKNFLDDMNIRPENTTLDRINNEGNYESQNCRWANVDTQARNRRSTLSIEYKGETKCLMDWSLCLNIPYRRLMSRIWRSKWSIEKAFETPVLNKRRVIVYNGEKKTMDEWAKIYEISISCLRYRMFKKNMSFEDATKIKRFQRKI